MALGQTSIRGKRYNLRLLSVAGATEIAVVIGLPAVQP